MRKRAFNVTVLMADGVDVSMMAQYIYDAVSGWTGGMDPDHPLGCKDIDIVVSYECNGRVMKVQKEIRDK